MATDIILDDQGGKWITLSAGIIKTSATDFMIDNPHRRKDDPDLGFRRALVHDPADGLTVNFAYDYPGGLTLNGVVRITPRPLKPDEGPIDTSAIPKIPNVTIDGGIRFVWNHGGVSAEESLSREKVNLQTIIEDLRREIIDLQGRVTALGG